MLSNCPRHILTFAPSMIQELEEAETGVKAVAAVVGTVVIKEDIPEAEVSQACFMSQFPSTNLA